MRVGSRSTLLVAASSVAAMMVGTLGACGIANGGTPEPSRRAEVQANATDLYPCNLVTADEAEQAYGARLLTPTLATQTDGAQVCTFAAADGSGAASIAVAPGAGSNWTITHDSYASQYPDFADLPGLGDAAFTTGQQVYVLAGDNVLTFAVVLPYHDRVAERSLALATAAAPRF